MASFSILCLGTRTDAETWRAGVAKLGFEDNGASITDPSPTMNELKQFFGASADWVFFGGHFTDHLYNDRQTVHVHLYSDQVTLNVDSETETIKRTDGRNFKLSPKVVFWGGCSVLHRAGQIKATRELFNNPLQLGFGGLTGPKIMNALLGKGFIPEDRAFFGRIKNRDDREQVRQAWMETANWGYGGGDIEDNFRAVDPDGKTWGLSNKKIKELPVP
jgi:hypothetical protein